MNSREWPSYGSEGGLKLDQQCTFVSASERLRRVRGNGFDDRGTQGGFSLLEVIVATSLIVIGVAALSRSVLSGSRLTSSKEESSQAHNALSGIIETLQGETFEQIYARYNSDPADDPAGPGTAPGPNFTVRGLTPALDDPDGFVGLVQFPDVGVGGAVRELRESVVDAVLGMPRDLNGDGATDALDHSADYIVLPVRITLQWRGQSTDRLMVFELLMTPR